MEPVRLGVIGCGVIGPKHLALGCNSEWIEVVAVADLIEDRVRAAAEKFNVPRVYAEGDDLIEQDDDVEAVVLAFPTAGRTDMALHAFAKGKHVLTEKPVAMNATEVTRMIEARGDLIAACCSSRKRFQVCAAKATEFVASGALGELRNVRCRFFASARETPEKLRPSWRLRKAENGGGILVNWGCYDLDWVLGTVGWSLEPRTVLARTWRIPPAFESYIVPDSDAETHYVALILCEGGTVITIERGEYMAAAPEASWEIVGSNGTLKMIFADMHHMERIVFDEGITGEGVVTKTIWEGAEDISRMKKVGPVVDFARAIREKRAPMTNLEQSMVIQKITDAVYASAEQGTAVDIN